MGLFSKQTKEEKEQAKEEKVQAKEEKKQLRAETKDSFKQMLEEKGVKNILTFITKDDTANIIPNRSTVQLYILTDYTIILKWMPFGHVKSTYDVSTFNFINIDWIFDIENTSQDEDDKTFTATMIKIVASKFIGGLSSEENTNDNSIAILTLQNKETHDIRMLSFNCTAQDISKYNLLPKTPLHTNEVVDVPVVDSLDQLKKLKELLDLDIITREEFDQKKAQLLAL